MTTVDTTPVPDYSRMLRLDGRNFVVVGAGQGMGRQTAHALASQGADILCVDLDESLARAVAREVGGVACVADARVAADAQRMIAVAQSEFGGIHGIADVVGMARYSALVDMPEEDWDWCHDMVIRHAFHMLKYGGPALASQGGGSIVFVSSISGISSSPFHGAYGAAKAGLISLVRTAAIELRPSEVRVNSVAPGGTATPRIVESKGGSADELATGSLSAYGSTSDIASAILFLSCDLSRHITGQTLAVDGGVLANYPVSMEAPALPPGQAMGEGGVEQS